MSEIRGLRSLTQDLSVSGIESWIESSHLQTDTFPPILNTDHTRSPSFQDPPAILTPYSSSNSSSDSLYRARPRSRNRSQKFFRGRKSSNSVSHTGYEELVFDSRSIRSTSSSSVSISSTNTSSSFGRRGPLSKAARVMAKAVKAVGACWRCKILRKTVGITALNW